MKGILTQARDIIKPLLVGGWNEKQIGSNAGGGQYGWIDAPARGVNGTIITPSDYATQIGAFKGPVHAALDLISKRVGGATLRIYKPKSKADESKYYWTKVRPVPEPKKTKMLQKANPGSVLSTADDVEEIVGGHRLIDLFRFVNSVTDLYQLQYNTAAYNGLIGNCYWVLFKDPLGIPTGIWLAPGEYMRVKPDQDMLIAGYIYKHGALEKHFATDEVIHFKMPAPGQQFQFYGRGTLMGAADDFNLLQYIYQFEKALFENGGIPATMLSVTGNWSPAQREDFEEQYKQKFGGVGNAGKPMVGENVKVERIGIEPKEMAYQGSRHKLKEDIAGNMGVPVAMLTGQTSTRAGLESSLAQIAIFSIGPMLELMQQAINAQLVPLYKDQIYCEYDSAVPEDKEFELEEDTQLKQAGIVTVNEIRAKRGLEPKEGGDELPQQAMGMNIQETVNNALARGFEEARQRIWGE